MFTIRYYMIDFWEGLRDVLVVTIPTLIGAISSKYIVNYWQLKKDEFNLRKEKFDLRKEILENYTKSYVQSYSILTGLLWEIYLEYNIPVEISKENQKSVYKVVFSADEESPLLKFGSKFNEVSKTTRAMGAERVNFYAIVSVYFKNKELLIKLGKVTRLLADLELLLNALIRSKDEEQFKRNQKTLFNTHDTLNAILADIAIVLSEHPIRKPPV